MWADVFQSPQQRQAFFVSTNYKKMTEQNRLDYYNLLILTQSFESFWAYNFLSEGELFENEAKVEAEKLVKQAAIVYKFDKGIYNSKTITMDSNDSEDQIRETFKRLKQWSKSKEHYPNFFDRNNSLGGVNFYLQMVIMCLKAYLLQKLKIKIRPHVVYSSGQSAFKKYEIRWRGHLPWQALSLINKTFIEDLSKSDTLVIVADIRKSQDLMTYGPDADFFRDKIIEFTEATRKIIKENYGIFDKFTGDGFLCYFNSNLCEKFGFNYYKQMLKAVNEIMSFAEPFFEEWIKHIRKLPPNSSGLTIGIDSGNVIFRDLDNHLFAIGDSIVWANRMSSAGKKGEIIVNNLPYHRIREIDPTKHFETIENTTKGGDAFTAYKMT